MVVPPPQPKTKKDILQRKTPENYAAKNRCLEEGIVVE
jgi:hypothetical protein